MRLKFPNHAQDMIQQRGLDIDDIKSAIRAPDYTESTFSGRMVVRKEVGDKTIEVIYYKDGFRDTKDYVVITAYYL